MKATKALYKTKWHTALRQQVGSETRNTSGLRHRLCAFSKNHFSIPDKERPTALVKAEIEALLDKHADTGPDDLIAVLRSALDRPVQLGNVLNSDGIEAFDDLLTNYLRDHDNQYMPKVDVKSPHLKQYELLLNETYAHPEKGRMAGGMFTPREVRRYIIKELAAQLKALNGQRKKWGEILGLCANPDKPVAEQL